MASRFQRQALEAEAGGQALQLLAEEAREMRRVARRQAGADRHRLHVAVHAEGQQHQAPRAAAGLFQFSAQRRQQAVERGVYGLARHDRFQELP